MNLISSLVEFLIILISHSICGIYSSTLKYSKKISYFVWAMWMFFQGTVFFIAEFIIKRKFYFFFKDFMTGIKTRPAEISSVKMIGPSIRSVLVSMI